MTHICNFQTSFIMGTDSCVHNLQDKPHGGITSGERDFQARSLAFISLLPILLFLVLLFLGTFVRATDAQADQCSQCQTDKKITCSNRCENSTDRIQYDSCVSNCLTRSCSKQCRTVRTDDGKRPGNTPQNSCQTCLYKQLQLGCTDKCDMTSPRYDHCRKSCAKQKCTKECSLPDAGFETNPPLPKHACDQCKVSAEYACRANPSCRPGEPGAIACQFHCVAKTCEQVCSQEQIDQEEEQ